MENTKRTISEYPAALCYSPGVHRVHSSRR